MAEKAAVAAGKHIFSEKPMATDAALLLRQAERAVGTGRLTLTARPGLTAYIAARPEWIAALQSRTGRPVALVADATLQGAGHAQ